MRNTFLTIDERRKNMVSTLFIANKRRKSMKNTVLTLVTFITLFVSAQDKLPFKLEKDWEISGFEAPESAVLYKRSKVLFVSNISGGPTEKNGKGYISKVGLNGIILEKKWVKGLNAPKGLSIYKRKLYATDIDEIVEIDLKTGEVVKFPAEGATFLNDIAVDKKGNVYASNTFGFSAVYRLPKKGNRKVGLWLKHRDLNSPNGLYAGKNKLYVVSWGLEADPQTFETKTPGKFFSIDLETKVIKSIADDVGNLDGIQATLHGFIISDWIAGKLLYYSKDTHAITEALTLKKGNADIFFDKKTKSVYSPLMLDGKLVKYHFKK